MKIVHPKVSGPTYAISVLTFGSPFMLVSGPGEVWVKARPRGDAIEAFNLVTAEMKSFDHLTMVYAIEAECVVHAYQRAIE